RDAGDLGDVERYWRLLAEHGRTPAFDWQPFVTAIDALYGESPAPEAGIHPLQIMTMHRAKGLEFDIVIAPGLAQPPGSGDPPLLRWRAGRAAGAERRLLFAPIQKQGEKADSQYEYLRRCGSAEERHELGRLLYVSATRARDALHWVAVVPPAEVDFTPAKDTSLGMLWDALGGQWPRPSASPPPSSSPLAASPAPGVIDPGVERITPSQRLYRLPADWHPPAMFDLRGADEAEVKDATDADSPPFDWAQDTARAIGIVAHDYFRRLGNDGLASWPRERLERVAPSLRTALAEEGVPADELDAAHVRVQRALATMLDSARAAWMFDPAHADARSEFAVTTIEADRLTRIVVDRTFVEHDGTRWIVDFKTSMHAGADLAAFLDREVVRHRPQLEGYARALAQMDAQPIKVGIYWPLHDEWREWTPVTI
ncbi:MAG: 3'-5' exonuclease, partial [Casimicrobiaceae bacterium]